jgi:uncharacterized protein (DUF433 family)
VSISRPPYADRIVTDPAVLAGKPVVRGTRIPVELVLRHLAQDPDLGELFAAYPRLTLDDVKACLAYAGALVEAVARPSDPDRRGAAQSAG